MSQASPLLRFALVGAAVALAYVALYLLFLQAGMGRGWANALAFGLAVAGQYVGQTLFTFRRRLIAPRQAMRFAVMIGLGLASSAAITGGLAPAFGLPDLAAAIAVTVILPVQNYILMKAWVYAAPATCSEV
ncbi:Putative flippase GtrA (transmembrane translocase of bactoprenol-linked glucose) [Cribrihabitans marinus]|uniref:Putative flippase GtrA (Transmembrane translocase of bactoprenol-linked glucose) n=1 Tax=Cribrihabitans marinus TaxID=1227549 RepID=A0A1H7BVN6_9RHOB|nr:GtrA family protein [Cribrihabitans marinus]GGH34169.1 hypothetical protein GCM10010973_26680 [Cribrihabitans marinus]SEJ78752.1 Putative flippase GtrA (transmembrane translocase of bactoprenol-linked glucose) [Cribrihabitans marinus]